MIKQDKYHVFDRECPFKEEWNSEDDNIRYTEVRKRLIKISKDSLNEKLRKEKIS